MKVVLYARVSHDESSGKSMSIEGQLREMRKYVERQEWKIYQEFQDCGISGRNDKRPGFQEMIKLAQQEPLDIVLVWSYARFSRNYEQARLYQAVLRRYEVEVISATEPFEQPFATLQYAIAEYAVHNLAKYTRMAMRERTLQGYSCGGVPPFGYRRVSEEDSKKVRLEPDPEYAHIVKRIFDLSLKGYQIKDIAELFATEKICHPRGSDWSYSRIYKILKNEVYTGILLYGKNSENQIRIPQAHRAIVSEEVFAQVQNAMKPQLKGKINIFAL